MNQSTGQSPVKLNRRPPTTRRGFMGLLSVLAVAFGAGSAEWSSAQKRGFRQGKHNGQNPGAFGRVAAKSHRALYVA